MLVPRGTAAIITPHWGNARAYGDLTHKWPPVTEFWYYYYLAKKWRDANAPHNDFYRCDFECQLEYTISKRLAAATDEQKRFALANFRDAAEDLKASLTKV